MKKRRVLYLLLTAAFSIALMFPVSTALAYDFEGGTYNDNDFYKMQAFLDTMSDDGVHTNGTRLNPAYESNKPTTWGMGTAILWSDGTSDKRFTQLLLGISGLKGSLDLSGFTGLGYVEIRDNLISDVNVSGDTAITFMDVRRTRITELDASGLTSLDWLNCNECPNLTDLDVSGCTSLTTLIAAGSAAGSTDIGMLDTLNVSGCTSLETNRLTALEVGDCTALESLKVKNNDIASLDVGALGALKTLDCEGNVHLASLKIKGASSLESVNCPGCALSELDASGLTSLTNLNCGVNDIETLNVTGDTALEYLDCNTNEIDSLSVAGFTNIILLNCAQNNITEIEGLSDAAGLAMMACSYNTIETLDVSGMTKLQYLMCDNNKLNSLDVSGDTALAVFTCANNLLKTLDISGAASLMMIDATGNRFSSIKAMVSGNPVNLTANGGGYVELYFWVDEQYFARAIPITGETFINWTDDSDDEFTDSAQTKLFDDYGYDLTANFTALELNSSVSGGNIYNGGRITLTPSIEGGVWEFDSEYLSRDGNKFTGLKEGKTQVKYSTEEESVTYNITISEAGLPETGQDSAFLYIAAIGAALALILAAAGTLIHKRASLN